MNFEYQFFLGNDEYGLDIALKYNAFREENSAREDMKLSDRMNYMGRFCAEAGLRHPDVFLEIEDAREKQRLKEMRKSAIAGIMVRGGSVAAGDSLRRRVEQKIKENGKFD
ncbi:MAG: hypothetical protein Q8Q31_00460 [Nanoarchaeota archaeon]|nr:hypothetical protein [Nanoarchaeota archaeon]